MFAADTVPVLAVPATVVVTMLIVGAMALAVGREEIRRVRTSQEVMDFWAAARTFDTFVDMMGMITVLTAEVYNQTPSMKPDYTIEIHGKNRSHEPNPTFNGVCKGIDYKFELRQARLRLSWGGATSGNDYIVVDLNDAMTVQLAEDLRAMISRRKKFIFSQQDR